MQVGGTLSASTRMAMCAHMCAHVYRIPHTSAHTHRHAHSDTLLPAPSWLKGAAVRFVAPRSPMAPKAKKTPETAENQKVRRAVKKSQAPT
eukprot:6055060-Alexandrium_andersonii.AAC.1